ncbi:MAG: (E)-4-hydroxy-3-methylbut-2-enyl-diphosphate synthase [Planctomycetaceae bacterium]|jgi:(E)-4-hydroxy-3-methylbut-2-enyl-diphosphate synthase|nr:(E)-4-hydroxy-3-methylbut-2-enyl-diphosphate synthase [Planctomycetaceae bacterium]
MLQKRTRLVRIGTISIGGGEAVAIQSMAATKTIDFESTAATCQHLADAGAAIVRIAVDSKADAEALREIRKRTTANLSVDLQENYKLAALVAPYVDKIRYNPGHLHHSEPQKSWQDKVKFIVQVARDNDCAIRIGVNYGSLDPNLSHGIKSHTDTDIDRVINSAIEHAEFIDTLNFTRYCVSIKSSDPATVTAANRRFNELRPDIPLHLGVTEAGLLPEGLIKSRAAIEPLLAEGIGDTLRVSLTVSNDRKVEEIIAGKLILDNVRKGTIHSGIWKRAALNIISCPSCARVENERFVMLAEQIYERTRAIQDYPLTIAVMGCRVNGPGETDNADFGIWCGVNSVNLKQNGTIIGTFSYEEVIPKLLNLIEDWKTNIY